MKKHLLFIVAILSCLQSYARDFSSTYLGQTLWYTVISEGDKTCEIKAGHLGKTGQDISGDLIIPDKVSDGEDEYTVAAIGNCAFWNATKLKSVVIPNSVVKIGGYAFYDCRGLGSVTIGNSVTDIEGRTFYNCPLTSLTLGESVATIGKEAFSGEYSWWGCSQAMTITAHSLDISGIRGSGFWRSNPLTVKTDDLSGFSESEMLYFNDITFETGKGSYVIGESDSNIKVDGCLFTEGCMHVWPKHETSARVAGDVLCVRHIGKIVTDQLRSDTGYIFVPQTDWSHNKFDGYGSSSNVTTTREVTLPQAGTLAAQIGIDNVEKIEALKINGDINGTDFLVINRMNALKYLDLRNANIVAGGTEYYEKNVTKANTLGAYSFFNNTIEVLYLPESLETISQGAFSKHTSLIWLYVGKNVIYMDAYFGQYSRLKGMYFEDGEKTIKLPNPYQLENPYIHYSWFSEKSLETLYMGRNIANAHTAFGSCSPFTGQSNLKELTIGPMVTLIDYQFFKDCTSLLSVDIPNSVKTIGISTFEGCTKLQKITFGDSLEEIGEEAFKGCTNLTDFTLPANITTIGWCAFTDCKSLTRFTIPASVMEFDDSALGGCNGIREVVIEDSENILTLTKVPGAYGGNTYLFDSCPLESAYMGRSIAENNVYGLFSDQSNLKKVEIGDKVTVIGREEFMNCTALTEVTIPASVSEIHASAFEGCTNLRSVNMPNSVTSISSCTFKNCSNLQKIGLPQSLNAINGETFSGCTNLTEIFLPEGLTTIGKSAFDCCPLYSLTIPSTVTKIGESAFMNCQSLKSVSLSPTKLSIGKDAFGNCFQLLRVNITDLASWCKVDFASVMSSPLQYGGDLYIDGRPLTFIDIPEGVEAIGNYAFYGSPAIETVRLPSTMKTIGEETFISCVNIKDVYSLNTTPPAIKESTFGERTEQTAKLHVPTGATVDYWIDKNWTKFLSIDENLEVDGLEEILIDYTGNITVYDINGIKIYEGMKDEVKLPAGIYIIRQGMKTVKVKFGK